MAIFKVNKDAFVKKKAAPKRKPGTEYMIEKTAKNGQRKLVSPSIRPLRQAYKALPNALADGWQEIFLDELRMKPIVSRAARIAGVARRTAYYYKESDPEFDAAWEDALAEGKERILEILDEQAENNNTLAAIYLANSYGHKAPDTKAKKGDNKITVGWED